MFGCLQHDDGLSQIALTLLSDRAGQIAAELKVRRAVCLGFAYFCQDGADGGVGRSRDAHVETTGSDRVYQFVQMGAEQDHSAVVHVLLHSASEATLGFFAQFVRLVDEQHFERFAIFSL